MIARLFAVLEDNVAGANLRTLSVGVCATEDDVARAISDGISGGVLERWPFWPERIRATGCAATPFLESLAHLRRGSWESLARINAASGWPATLHLLISRAHAVVERFPWHGDPDEIAREQSRYARPRSLREGATAMAIVAHMPERARSALFDQRFLDERAPLFEEIRTSGCCLRRARDMAGGWVLSAPLRGADGAPYGALCTYGFADTLLDHFAAKAAAAVSACAAELSPLAGAALIERARAVVDAMASTK